MYTTKLFPVPALITALLCCGAFACGGASTEPNNVVQSDSVTSDEGDGGKSEAGHTPPGTSRDCPSNGSKPCSPKEVVSPQD